MKADDLKRACAALTGPESIVRETTSGDVLSLLADAIDTIAEQEKRIERLELEVQKTAVLGP